MMTTLLATVMVSQAGQLDFCWDCSTPPALEVLDAAVQGALVLSVLTSPANLALLGLFLSRHDIPVTRESHRTAGWGVYAYGLASALLGGLTLAFLPSAEWLGAAVFFAAPALLGLVTWLVQFRRAIEDQPARITRS